MADYLSDAMMRRGIPGHMHGGLRRYIESGIPPGSFLSAVLSNDLKGAFGKADDENLPAIGRYVMFLYNDAPGSCWGSPAKVAAWIERGGLSGAESAAAAPTREA